MTARTPARGLACALAWREKLEDRTRFWLAFFPHEPPLAPMNERASHYNGPSAEMKQTA